MSAHSTEESPEVGNEQVRLLHRSEMAAAGSDGCSARLPDAVEEILRWVSPISHFTRTATEDYEVRGTTIRSGQQVALYFASANRDEAVFDDPFAFRVDRRPNPHLAFGFGEHFCMGAQLARVEAETIFRHLLARLESFEVVGTVERLRSIVNGSIKHLPFSYSATQGPMVDR
jgi:cytochrome P450